MKTILLVDDSDAQRSPAHHLLAQCHGAQVQSCPTNETALELLKLTAVDVVVAELHANGLNGINLLQEIRAIDSTLPVVLVADAGCEESAMLAMRMGAAGYVPKRHYEQHLVATVDNVLEARMRDRDRSQALRHVTGRHVSLSLPNDLDVIRGVTVLLQELATSVGVIRKHDSMRLGLAIEEALSNAIIHGNLEVNSDLREEDDSRFDDLIRQRAVTPPYSGRRVEMSVHATPRTICIEIEDEGPGFDADNLPDPTDPENLLRASGRGLLLIQAYMDDVLFNDRGNRITMIKHHKPTPSTRSFSTYEAATR